MPQISSLTDTVIGREVGQAALARGFVYAATGRVESIAVNSADVLSGRVRGTHPHPYDVIVEFEADGPGIAWSHCSCPIGGGCKHVAAVLLAHRHTHSTVAEPQRPGWEVAFGPLLDPGPGGPAPSASPLGLRIEVTDSHPSAPCQVQCKPVRRGRSGSWVQQNVSWGGLSGGWQREFDPAHAAALDQLQRVARGADHYYYGSSTWLDLTDSPRLLWTALADVAAAGVELVAGAKQSGPVEVSAVAAELALDVTSVADADLSVRPRLTLSGDDLIVTRVGFLGDPAHGIVALRPGRAGLLLAPLTRTFDRATQGWLERLAGSIEVPAADRDRFLAEFAPRLRPSIRLTSTDDSVDFPAPSAPGLRLGLHHGGPGEVALDWSVGYRVGTREITVDPTAAAPGSTAIRDPAAERTLWVALADALGPHASGLGVVPPIRELVRRRTGLDAATFCAEIVPLLVDAGVEVTETGESRTYRRSDAEPQIAFTVSETDDRRSDWFDLAVEVSMDGESVPFDLLFAALARGETQLILPSGTYFSLGRPEYARLADLIAEARLLQDREREGLRINVRQPSLWEDLVACGAVTEQAARWRQAIEVLGATSAPPDVAVPAGLRAELRPYQQQGYAWLHRLYSIGIGGILADDMGLGKTLQALALICAARERDPAPGRPFLVVAPTSVVSNWATEAARFAPDLRVVAVERTEAKRGTALAELTAAADLVITSYTLLRIDAERYEALDWRGLILDEAQFVKNYTAKTYACIRRLGVGFTVAMTGTPLENSLMDLWSMLSLAAPGMFPSPQKFTEYYRTPIERGEAPERLALLQRRIAPVMLRRTKDLVAAELPAKQEQVLEVELHPKHARLYATQLQRERQKILRLIGDLDENRFTILASLTLLRQLSLEAALVDEQHEGVPSAKLDVLTEMLPELVAEGHRALVFSQFTRFLRRIGDRLTTAGVPYAYLDGQTRQRAKVIDDFRSGDKGVFLISLKAGGFGLNLTEADYCFVCDPWWNPAAEAQAVDRAHRIGQTRPVMVYRLVSKDTIEEKVMELKARKEALFSSVLSGDGLPAGALSSDDIRELLAG